MNPMRTRCFALAALALMLMQISCSLAADEQSTPTPAPYPRSSLIKSLTWHWETYTNAAIGSDLWPVTWGPDDCLYTAWGDGGGFGGSDTDGRVSMGFARIEGPPEHWRAFNINGGKNAQHPASFGQKGKTAGLLSVDGGLYALINLQDGEWPHVTHALAWSTNAGTTWVKAPWTWSRETGTLQPATFLNFGKDYRGVPKPLSGYIYIYGAKIPPGRERVKELYLLRAPQTQMTEQKSYEYFSGLTESGAPSWRSDPATAKPVFTDTNGIGTGSAVYAPALKRYLLAGFHVGPGQLGIFEGATPWGPWRTVEYEESWGGMGQAGEGLTCSFPGKWMSKDGLTLWSVFSVYGGSAKEGIHAHDRFNLIKATLER